MSLKTDLAKIQDNLKTFEHKAAGFLETVVKDVDELAPLVDKILGVIPAARPYQAVFDEVHVLLDAVDAWCSGAGNAAPAEVTQALQAVKAAIAKAKP